jgi:hypothetical protein|tara:strand:+ start:82 stop:249 length:168 start_codon:yes stop_codon:yes gene_type:complete
MIHTDFLYDDWINFPLDEGDFYSGDWNDFLCGSHMIAERRTRQAKIEDNWWFHEE